MSLYIFNYIVLFVVIGHTYGCSSSCSSCTIPTSNCCQQACRTSCIDTVCSTETQGTPEPKQIVEERKESVESGMPSNSNPINVTSIMDVKNEIHNTNEIHVPINITNINTNSVNNLGGRTTESCKGNCTSVDHPVPRDRLVPVPHPVPVPVPIPIKHTVPVPQPYPMPIAFPRYIPIPPPCTSPCNPYPLTFGSNCCGTGGSFNPLPPFFPFNMFSNKMPNY